MKILTGHCKTIYSILKRGGNWTILELCNEIGFPIENKPTDLYYFERLRGIINILRKKFEDNRLCQDNPWYFVDGDDSEPIYRVGTDVNGYTLKTTNTGRVFEARIRRMQSLRTILAAESLFEALTPKAQYTLELEIKPQQLRVNNILQNRIKKG